MKKLLLPLLLTAVMIFAGSSMSKSFAQSTVYIFSVESWVPIPIKINNQKVFDLKGTPKGKDLTARYSPCKKKCTLYSKDKVIFSFEFSRTNAANTSVVYKYADEIHLNLSDNSVHYLLVKPKGFNDYTFSELTEKEAQKLLNDKKYVLTDEYVESVDNKE